MISKSLLCLQFIFSPFSKKFTTGSDPSYSVLHVEIKRLCVSLSFITGWFRTSLLPVRNSQDLGTLPPESLYSLSCLSVLRVISFSFLSSSSLPSSTAHPICPEHDKRMPKNPSHPDVKHATFLPPTHKACPDLSDFCVPFHGLENMPTRSIFWFLSLPCWKSPSGDYTV